MSASNWAICPKCIVGARLAAERQHADAMASYGTVPAEEFQARIASIKDVNPEDFRTFREDYEIYGTEDGEVTVSYSGHCRTCGAGLEFTDRHVIPGVLS
jgi:hypothetical protein